MEKFELSVVSNGADSNGRTCGECQVCCEYFQIPELDKPRGAKCRHQCDKGCAIWGQDSRPKRCNEFRCGWLSGQVGQDERHRPDRSGVMLMDVQLPGVGWVPAFIELRRGAADEYWVTKAANKIARKHPVVIFDVNKKIRTVGKTMQVAAFKHAIEQAVNE